MLVGSHAETGDERKAVAAPLPHIIGNVQTAAGSGTLRRATCTAAQVTAGDPQAGLVPAGSACCGSQR